MKLHAYLKIVPVLCVLCLVAPAFGEGTSQPRVNELTVDVMNLEESVPMWQEDAYVLPGGASQLEGVLRWGTSEEREWLEFGAQATLGLGGGWQATAGGKGRSCDLDKLGNGDTFFKLMRQLHSSDKDAFLCAVDVNFPTGTDYSRMDYSYPPFAFMVNHRQEKIDVGLIGVYTRILNAEKTRRLHLEMRENIARSTPAGFSDTQLVLAATGDKLVRKDVLAMVSVSWFERENIWNSSYLMLGGGLRHQVSPRFLWGLSLSTAIDRAPEAKWGMVWGSQYSF